MNTLKAIFWLLVIIALYIAGHVVGFILGCAIAVMLLKALFTEVEDE